MRSPAVLRRWGGWLASLAPKLVAGRAVLEMAIFLGIALALDVNYFGGDRFWALQPHPFWAIVLLIAVQYGTNEALLSAALASIVLLTGDLPQQDFDETHLEHLFQLARLPLLWLMASVIVGELALRHRRQRAEAQAEAAKERQRADELADAYQKSRHALSRLEDHVASGVTSSVSVLAMSAQLDPRSPGQALQHGMAAISRLLAPDKFSVAFLHQGHLVVGLQEGWAMGDTWTTDFGPESSLFQAIVGEQRRVVVTDKNDQAILGQEGVVAAPLRDAAQNRIMGMIKIEAIDFAYLTFSKVEMMTPLGDWIGSSYAQALRHYRSAGSAMLAADLPVNSRAFLQRQMAVLQAIAERAGFPVALVRIELARSAAEVTPASLAQAVAQATSRTLRNTDLAFEESGAQGRFVVMLPLAGRAGAEVTRDRLRRDIAQQFGQPVADLPVSYSIEVIAGEGADTAAEAGDVG